MSSKYEPEHRLSKRMDIFDLTEGRTDEISFKMISKRNLTTNISEKEKKKYGRDDNWRTEEI